VYDGKIGCLLKRLSEQTLIDPDCLLGAFLTYAGAHLGASASLSVGEDEHQPRLFTVLADTDDRAARNKRAMKFAREVFSTAEAIAGPRNFPPPIIRQVATLTGDHFWAVVPEGETQTDARATTTSEASTPRVLLEVQDFGPTWRVTCQQNNQLPSLLAMAFEQSELALIVPRRGLVTHRVGLSLLGRVSQDQIRDALTGDSRWHGLASSVLWVAERGSPASSPGWNVDKDLKDELICELALAIRFADKTARVCLSPDAKLLCSDLSGELHRAMGVSDSSPSASEGHLHRLVTIYALLNRNSIVEPAHVEAAMAFLRYCASSAQLVFTDHRTDEMTERVVAALNEGPKTQTQLHALFSRKLKASQLNRVLTYLLSRGLVSASKLCEGGRPTIIWKRVPALTGGAARSSR
jgi:hypothetical protein